MGPRKLTRRETIGLAGTCAAGAALAGVKGAPWLIRRLNPKKHIIFIVADALRADMIGRKANGLEITPHINRLAEKSLVFTNAYAASAQTKFSVASLMTGLYPPAHGVELFMHTLSEWETIQRFFAGRGWRTLAIGANPYLARELFLSYPADDLFGFQNGFDDYFYLEGESAPDEPDGGLFEAYAAGSKIDELYFSFLGRFLWKKREKADQSHFAYLHYMDSHQPWVRSAPVPGVTGKFHPADLGGEDVHVAGGEAVEPVRPGDVTMQALAVELREHVDPVDAGVQAVRDRDVDQPELAGDRDGRFGPVPSERPEAGSLPATENRSDHVAHEFPIGWLSSPYPGRVAPHRLRQRASAGRWDTDPSRSIGGRRGGR